MLFFFQAEDGIRDLVRSRGLGDVYKRQIRHDAKLRLCVLRIDSQHATLDRVSAGALLPLDRGAAGHQIVSALRALKEKAKRAEGEK